MFNLFSTQISVEDLQYLENEVNTFMRNYLNKNIINVTQCIYIAGTKMDLIFRIYFTLATGGVYEKLLPMDYYFSKALYTFDIGQNDLTSGFKQNMTFDQVKAYIPDVLRQFSNVIKVKKIKTKTKQAYPFSFSS